jgi:CTP synthase (UTP-ammonia lyase)
MSAAIAALGDRNLDYLTHRELDAALALFPADVEARWIATDSAEAAHIDSFDGLWLVPGTPYRDDDAAYAAVERARCAGMPLLGTCGGFQYMLVEFARNVAGSAGAAHAESDPEAAAPVVDRLSCSLVGEERTVVPVPGTRLAATCGDEPFTGFHYCNYGLAPGWVEPLEAAGLVIAARAADAGVEAVEWPAHPFYVATLFQPQVGNARAGALHPLIAAFAAAARERSTTASPG